MRHEIYVCVIKIAMSYLFAGLRIRSVTKKAMTYIFEHVQAKFLFFLKN